MRRPADEHGQASVELVAVLPVVAVLLLMLWQAVVAGQAIWLAGSAARAAARAEALGQDPVAAARAVLPEVLHRGLTARADDEGAVRIRVRIPMVLGGDHHLTTVDARARFRPQGG